MGHYGEHTPRCPPPAHRRLGESRAQVPVDSPWTSLRARSVRRDIETIPGGRQAANSCEEELKSMAKQVAPACHEPEPALGPFEAVWELRRGVRGFHQGPGTEPFPPMRPDTSVQPNLLATISSPLQLRGGPYKRGHPCPRERWGCPHYSRAGSPRSREVLSEYELRT